MIDQKSFLMAGPFFTRRIDLPSCTQSYVTCSHKSCLRIKEVNHLLFFRFWDTHVCVCVTYVYLHVENSYRIVLSTFGFPMSVNKTMTSSTEVNNTSNEEHASGNFDRSLCDICDC